jgi:hypothetical protein
MRCACSILAASLAPALVARAFTASVARPFQSPSALRPAGVFLGAHVDAEAGAATGEQRISSPDASFSAMGRRAFGSRALAGAGVLAVASGLNVATAPALSVARAAPASSGVGTSVFDGDYWEAAAPSGVRTIKVTGSKAVLAGKNNLDKPFWRVSSDARVGPPPIMLGKNRTNGMIGMLPWAAADG